VIAALENGEPRLFKIPIADPGTPIRLGDDYALDPVWSPSGRFLVYSGADVGARFPIKAINVDGTPRELPNLVLNRGARRIDFLGGDDDTLVVLKGEAPHRDFWAIDLRSGTERLLTDLESEGIIGDFDISLDGRELVFDSLREESDIVRIDLTARGK
jgi:hypothetical protein